VTWLILSDANEALLLTVLCKFNTENAIQFKQRYSTHQLEKKFLENLRPRSGSVFIYTLDPDPQTILTDPTPCPQCAEILRTIAKSAKGIRALDDGSLNERS